jgi:transcriptional regulator with XRE-family HTH domain
MLSILLSHIMPKLLPSKELGTIIRDLRKRLGLTQAEFAERLELKLPGGQTQVSGWEAGRGIALDTLEKIAEKCGVPLSVFYVEEPTTAQPLTTQDVVRLRDQVRELRDTADGMLAALEGALNGGAPVLQPKRDVAPVAPGEPPAARAKRKRRA